MRFCCLSVWLRRWSQAGAAPAIHGDSAFKLNFQNVPVQALVPLYSQLTGNKIIQDSSLQSEPLRIVAPEPLPAREAISFIEATILLNGYVFIPVDSKTVKLIHHSGGKSPTPEGLPVYRSMKELPPCEEIYHFILPLELLIFMQPSMINSRDPFNHPNQIEAHRRQIMDETLRFSMPREPVPRACRWGRIRRRRAEGKGVGYENTSLAVLTPSQENGT